MQPQPPYVFSRIPILVCTLLMLFLFSGCSRSSEESTAQIPLERINADGTAYTGSGNFATDPWSCVRDPRTNLVWEVKYAGAGLHSKEHTYSWYEPNLEGSEGEPGIPNNGICSHSDCDTRSFTLAVRAERLCGFDDWRVPGHAEIGSINDLRFRNPPPTIDPAYFPHTQAAAYWTVSTYGFYPESAWSWQFDLGHDRVDWKREPKYLRLVRGEVIHRPKTK